MTDFENSLIVIGGTFVAGVVLYNKWQEYKAKKSVERAFSSTHDDVLMTPADLSQDNDDGRHEPSFGGEGLDSRDISSVGDGSRQSEPIDNEPAVGNFTPPSVDLPIDEVIDCVISVALVGRVRGDKIMHSLLSLRHVGNKPVHFVGLSENQQWEPIAHGGIYVALRAGVQLANRSGMLNELEYSELISRLRQLSDEIDAEPDVPDMIEVMKSARALFQFVTRFDAKLSLNIESNGAPWSINTLLVALERQGFDVRPDGRLVMPDGDGGVLFSLSTNVTLAADTSSRLTLLLDVPCVAPRRDGYGAMISFAKLLAARLGGTVVDDTGAPLSDAALGEIAGQVQAFCGDMDATGISAGSARALRLFN